MHYGGKRAPKLSGAGRAFRGLGNKLLTRPPWQRLVRGQGYYFCADANFSGFVTKSSV